MRKKSFWSVGLAWACVVAMTAGFAVSSTGCIVVGPRHGCKMACRGKCAGKCACKCSGKCAGKCKTPCKNPDGTAKCGPDCKKPCCAKKKESTSDASAPGAGEAALAAATAKKPGCSKPRSKPCGMKGAKMAKCGPNCTKPCCAKKRTRAKAAAGT